MAGDIKWQAPEFEPRPKSPGWFWSSIFIAIAILSFAVWQKNFLFGVFIVIAEILILVWGNREPKTVDFSCSSKGLTIPIEKFYPWSDVAKFGVDEPGEDSWGSLWIDFKGRFRPSIKILVPKSQFPAVRELMRGFLPEVEREPSFGETLERFFHF